MEDRIFHPQPSNEDSTGILRTIRDVPPAHYTFQIVSFSSLLEIGVEKYESCEFEAGGYKWYLSLYPNGNEKNNGNGHISLYLAIVETDDLPLGWEINVNFKLFVLDQIQDRYLTIQDSDGRVRRYRKTKTEWGFAQLLSLDVFNDSTNGYLVDDCCMFGVEIFVIKGTGKGETLSIIKEPKNGCYTWKIEKFSGLGKECLFSNLFTVGGRKWKLHLFAKGNSEETSTSLSLFLALDSSEILPPRCKLYVKYKLRAKNQINSNHHEKSVSYWFDTPNFGYGYPSFLSLSDLKDVSKGYLVNDMLIVEAQIEVISLIK